MGNSCRGASGAFLEGAAALARMMQRGVIIPLMAGVESSLTTVFWLQRVMEVHQPNLAYD